MKQKQLGIKRQYENLKRLIHKAEGMDEVAGFRKAVAIFNSTHNNPFIMASLENLLITKSIQYNGEPIKDNKERLIFNLSSN